MCSRRCSAAARVSGLEKRTSRSSEASISPPRSGSATHSSRKARSVRSAPTSGALAGACSRPTGAAPRRPAKSRSMSFSDTPRRLTTSRSSSSRIAPAGRLSKIGRSSSRTRSRPSGLVASPARGSARRETHERQRSVDEAGDRVGAVALEHIRRIASGRQGGDAQLEALTGGDACRLHHCRLAGTIGVEGEHHARSKPGELTYLLVGQRRSHQPDAVAHAGLVRGDHVGVALAEDDRSRLGGVRASEVRGKQVASLVVDLAVGAVHVLAWIVGVHRARPEAEHAAALVAQREGDPPAEAVVDAARTVSRALHQPRRQEARPR